MGPAMRVRQTTSKISSMDYIVVGGGKEHRYAGWRCKMTDEMSTSTLVYIDRQVGTNLTRVRGIDRLSLSSRLGPLLTCASSGG